MMKFISKIKYHLNKIHDRKNQYLKLITIKQKCNQIYCEFTDIMNMNGNLIKIDIEKIPNNKNILNSIRPEELFIIGSIHNRYKTLSNEYRMRKMDLINKNVLIENSIEKISIKIDDLIEDKELLNNINRIDLLKIIYSFAFSVGCGAINSMKDVELQKNGHQSETKKTHHLKLI